VFRRFTDARVRSLPSAADLARLRARFPDATVQIPGKVGRRLSEQGQDLGSFRYGIVNLGGDSPADIEARWVEVQRLLPFVF